ncbi:MAG: hypothetical protein JWO03_2123 [Bacteroidetes bacterium]|nr:hypothetical protein [Bacteroidota bacterium]
MCFAIVFVVMFVIRLAYTYSSLDSGANGGYMGDFFGSIDHLRKNYASEKTGWSKQGKETLEQGGFEYSQKYEKTATVKSKTSQFDADAKKVQSSTKDFTGVVQYEQNTGKKGSRELHLMIGIAPEKFDSFYNVVQGIGIIKSTEITKTDKTNDYRKLNAKKASLDKTLTSLNELKSRSGAIADYIALHDKILEIETQLQELGVELGDFNSDNEFCTIKFSLYEGATERKMAFAKRLRIAFEWTVKYYAVVVFSVLMLSIASFIFIFIVDKLKIMTAITEKVNE